MARVSRKAVPMTELPSIDQVTRRSPLADELLMEVKIPSGRARRRLRLGWAHLSVLALLAANLWIAPRFFVLLVTMVCGVLVAVGVFVTCVQWPLQIVVTKLRQRRLERKAPSAGLRDAHGHDSSGQGGRSQGARTSK